MYARVYIILSAHVTCKQVCNQDHCAVSDGILEVIPSTLSREMSWEGKTEGNTHTHTQSHTHTHTHAHKQTLRQTENDAVRSDFCHS